MDYSINDAGTLGYPYGKKTGVTFQGYLYEKKIDPYFTPYVKIKFQVDQRPKCEEQNFQTFSRKYSM